MSHIVNLNYAFGRPTSLARFRTQPEDFQVKEQLSFKTTGAGQHVYLYIKKRNLNTDDLARQLARFADVKPVAIGYAGLKDRYAVTTQWFSIDLAGKPEPDWLQFNSEDVTVIESNRHDRKLKRGAIKYNQFQISLSQFEGDKQDVDQRLQFIKRNGVPNYFGEQRFGRNDANLKQAERLFLVNKQVNKKQGTKKRVNRYMRGIYLSAVRSFLFNQYLSIRVADNNWNQPIAGDVFMLDGSHSVFTVDAIDDEIVRRTNEIDIHPSGPMWGGGESQASGHALEIESLLQQTYPGLCELAVNEGLKLQRRALRCVVSQLEWQWRNCDELLICFDLPSGSYATSLLRETITTVL